MGEGTVTVSDGLKAILVEEKTKEDGTFTITIPQRKAKEKLIFVFEDTKTGKPNTSKVTVRVTNQTAPEFIGEINVLNSTRVITGILNEAGKVSVSSKGFPTIGFFDTEEDGSFTVKLSGWSLKKYQTITITAEDMIGNKKNYKFKVVQ